METLKRKLFQNLAGHLKQRGEEVYQLTLEDHAILARLNQHPGNLFEFVAAKPGKRLFVLIDEIQYLEDPSNFLKLIYDKYHSRVKIIATGSSAFYLDRKFKDSLAGRKQLFELYTLDFDEFLLFRTLHGTDDLRFWRTTDGSEVDFIIPSGPGNGSAIEVKFEETGYNPSKYRKFRENYPGYPLRLRAFRSSENQTSLIAL